ncbi:MAG: substrate-binding domain-containing protein [Candidatus Thermoplasmatota archaeon]
MTGISAGATLVAVVLIASAGLSIWDLQTAQKRTLVVYTTPALRDVLEKFVVPQFENRTGTTIALVYVAAGQQYNRLRMAGDHSEADLFLHASPLYEEQGYSEGHVDAVFIPQDASLPDEFKSRSVEGGRIWYAFAWSPLVEVYAPRLGSPPDIGTTDLKVGFAHPLLSNNGVYAALALENVSAAAGEHALAQTRVQPVNARANIGGVADGNFDVTMGYEAVTLYYRGQGANVAYDVPLIMGQRVTTPVLCSVALIHGDSHPQAKQLLSFLFEDATQDALHEYFFRPTLPGHPPVEGSIDVTGTTSLSFDWSEWSAIKDLLSKYEVRS